MIFSKLAWLFILSRILFMCQPWTIALTGVSIIAISWLFLHSVIITSLISSLICAWWYIVIRQIKEKEIDVAESSIQVCKGPHGMQEDNSVMHDPELQGMRKSTRARKANNQLKDFVTS